MPDFEDEEDPRPEFENPYLDFISATLEKYPQIAIAVVLLVAVFAIGGMVSGIASFTEEGGTPLSEIETNTSENESTDPMLNFKMYQGEATNMTRDSVTVSDSEQNGTVTASAAYAAVPDEDTDPESLGFEDTPAVRECLVQHGEESTGVTSEFVELSDDRAVTVFAFTGENASWKVIESTNTDSVILSEMLISSGHATVTYEEFADDEEESEMESLEQTAKNQSRGLWSCGSEAA